MKLGGEQTNFKIRLGTRVLKKSCSKGRFYGAVFLLEISKNHVQKTSIKNKNKCHFAKRSFKVAQNQELANERASQVNQAS